MPHSFTPTIQQLLDRSQQLLDELQTFKTRVKFSKPDQDVELATFRSTVQSEVTSLKRLAAANARSSNNDIKEAEEDPENIRRQTHLLRSSNVPFLELVWATAKRSQGVVGFSKRFYWDTELAKPSRDFASGKKRSSHRGKPYASIDIVTHGGAEWVKVSSVTETRLLFEIAGQGWPSSSEDDENGYDSDLEANGVADNTTGNSKPVAGTDSDDDHQISLLRLLDSMTRAAKATRCRYKHPRLRFVLPKLDTGRVPQIDSIIVTMRAAGAIVQTASDLPMVGNPEHNPPLSEKIEKMTPNPLADFSPTLNVDCTILLAIVSDLSHTDPTALKPQPWHHRALVTQIQRENTETLLPSVLYPAMGSRELVCTDEAAQRMREIVNIIGTPSEKTRAALILGESDNDDAELNTNSSDPIEDRHLDVISKMQELSDHPVPLDWKLPIRLVSKDNIPPSNSSITNDSHHSQPPASVLAVVSAQLTAINRSVFLFGWRSGYTTITSNRTAARQIERIIEEWRDGRTGAVHSTNVDDHASSGTLAGAGAEAGARRNSAGNRRDRKTRKRLEKERNDSEQIGLVQEDSIEAAVAGRLELPIRMQVDQTEASLDAEAVVGPDIWLCTTSRSLIGKEKGRKS